MTRDPNGVVVEGRAGDLPVLTTLRFFAASNVVIFHFFFPKPTGFWTSVLSSAPHMVTFFFVLSGFVLAHAYGGQISESFRRDTAVGFWIARAARILPAYMLGLAIALPAFAWGALVSKITPLEEFLQSLVLAPLLLQSFWPPAATMWNAPGWSLSVEMVFYFLFPVLIFGTRRLKPLAFLGIALFLLILVQGLRGAFMPEASSPQEAWNFYKFFPFWHIATFMVGVALARINAVFRPSWEIGMSLAFALAIGAIVVLMGFKDSLPEWVNGEAILVPLFGAVIFSAANVGGRMGMLTSPLLLLLGNASYGIYILHMPLLFWWRWLMEYIPLRVGSPALQCGMFFLFVVICAVGVLRFVEMPVRSLLLSVFTARGARRLIAVDGAGVNAPTASTDRD